MIRYGLGVGLGLVTSYYPVITITIISTLNIHGKQDCEKNQSATVITITACNM